MQQVDQLKDRLFHNFSQAEDAQLEITRAKFSNVLKRHGELTERLSRDSDKTVFERLQREFEAACASQTQDEYLQELMQFDHSCNLLRVFDLEIPNGIDSYEFVFKIYLKICLDGEQWNDGLLATIRERVHMEAERKALQSSPDTAFIPIHLLEKITYRVGNKMICCLEGARIGIQYETSFAGEPCELFHCVLKSKSFLEKMIVLEHTIPFFLPIRETENELLSSNAMKFIDHVGELLQAYVDRREQVRLIKELYGNQIGELYFSLPYHMVEFVLADSNCKITVSLRYPDLVAILPSGVSVLAWPMQKHNSVGIQPIPARLTYAEDALRTMSLPEAFAEIVLNLSAALKEVFSEPNLDSAGGGKL